MRGDKISGFSHFLPDLGIPGFVGPEERKPSELIKECQVRDKGAEDDELNP
jgi:hypothetical protein